MHITKASGESVAFDSGKLYRSLHRAGASQAHAEAIVRQVREQLYEGMTTKQIYRLAHRLLRRDASHTAARYSLKQALLGFGPSGFPFEQFIAKLLESDGFEVETGLVRQGHCVPHELDVFGQAGQRLVVGECKFHNRQHMVSDVKVSLYIHARFQDLLGGFLNEGPWKNHSKEGWIFTNTRFTDEALAYGRCSGLHLVSWNTPTGASLREWIDRSGLHPLTCLTTMTQQEKNRMLERNVVLAGDLVARPDLLERLAGMAPSRINAVVREAEQLCATRPE